MTTLVDNNDKEVAVDAVVAATELELLVELTAKERIGPAMLVQNLLPILEEEPGLLVDVVLQLTDPNRDFTVVAPEEYQKAYAAVLTAPRVRARQVLLRALADSANRAGYAGLENQAA
ncbi:hypothetical protein [Rubritalea tangerina]|uniref:Uncharacterized protein n=1 Tax=Rubritalea tangerina TaxID=430798 RepID=A0ABW4ZDP8_9BACT